MDKQRIDPQDAAGTAPTRLSAWAIFLIFLRLGLSSFGGPIAHLGYFRTEFVEKRRWLSEHAYADLVALASFCPGPRAARWALRWALRAVGMGAPWRPGSGLPCPRHWP